MRRSTLSSFQVPRPSSTLGPKTATTITTSSQSHNIIVGSNPDRKENAPDELNFIVSVSSKPKLLPKPIEGDLNDLLEGSDVVGDDQDTIKSSTILLQSNHSGSQPRSFSNTSVRNAETSSSVLPTKSNQNEKIVRYSIMYTKHSSKKRKIYSEGILSVNAETGRAELFDEDGIKVGQATKLLFNSQLEVKDIANLPNDFQFEMNGFDVEIVSRLNQAVSSTSATSVAASITIQKQCPKTNHSSFHPSTTRALAQPARQGFRKPILPVANVPSNEGPPPIVLRQGDPSTNQDPIVLDSFLARIMRPHQIEGAKFMFECVSGMRSHTNGNMPLGCGLLDDMGLGKTLQAIALVWTMIKQPRSNPLCKKAVVVCPASLVGNWAREFQKFLGPVRIRPIAVSDPEIAAKQVDEFCTSVMRPLLIVSYETYRKYSEKINLIRGFDLLICDEGHRLKSASGNKTIDALDGAPTRRRIILTGTPLQNELEEFYALVNFINPGILGEDARQFKRNFQHPIEKGRDKSSTKEERLIAEEKSKQLMDLTSTFLLRRTNEINTKSLPEKLETNVFIHLSPLQVNEYTKLIETECEDLLKEDDHDEEAQEATPQGAEMLRLISKLKQVCTVPTALSSPNSSADCLLMNSCKLRFVDAFITETIQAGDRMVLVSNVTSTLDLLEVLLANRSIPFCRLDGATKVADRQRVVNQFHSPTSKEKCFLLSSKAGGCGLNLIGANRLCMLDPDWNPAVDAQAMARVWREGQLKKVYIYRLFATGTIEERILQRQMMKLSVATGVVMAEGGGQKSQRMSREELKNLCVYVGQQSRCDTFDLMNGQKKKKKKSSKGTTTWKPYNGAEDIVDDQVLKSVVKCLGDDVVTFVQQSSSKDIPPQVIVEGADVDDEEASVEWDDECILDEDLLHEEGEKDELFENAEDDIQDDEMSPTTKRSRLIISDDEEEDELLS